MVGYAVTAGAVTGWRWYVLSSVVDDALRGEPPATVDRHDPERVRQAVLRGATEADVPLGADEVTVLADGNTVTVRVRHVYPAFEYGAQRIAIPITVERSRAFP